MEKPKDLASELPQFFGLMAEKLKCDPQYQVRLQEDLRSAALEVGWELPEKHPYRVYFDSATHRHFVIPSAPNTFSSRNSIRF
jgi:hypothetical protein